MVPPAQDALQFQVQQIRDARVALASKVKTVAEIRHQHAVERVFQVRRETFYDVPHPPIVKVGDSAFRFI